MPSLSLASAEAVNRHMRQHLAQWSHGAWLTTLGNWEGETGCAGRPHHLARRTAALHRLLHFPPPKCTVESSAAAPGSHLGDYYAFEWGDLLLVAINVLGYTVQTPHCLCPRACCLLKDIRLY
jgi:hypothetical protein